MHPVPTKALPKEHFEATVTLFLVIGPETERIDISECESVFYVFLWVFVGANEPFLDKTTVIDFECDCVVWCVLISKIHLTSVAATPTQSRPEVEVETQLAKKFVVTPHMRSVT